MPKSLLCLLLILLAGCSGGFNTKPAQVATQPAEPTQCYTLIPEDPPVNPGLMGSVEIDAPGYWVDSDGVKPDRPGIHTQFSDAACQHRGNAAPLPEACICLTGYAGRYLLETNPGAGECHPHKNGKGHPYVYDCKAFCAGSTDTGGESANGACKAAVVNGVVSARCECD